MAADWCNRVEFERSQEVSGLDLNSDPDLDQEAEGAVETCIIIVVSEGHSQTIAITRLPAITYPP